VAAVRLYPAQRAFNFERVLVCCFSATSIFRERGIEIELRGDRNKKDAGVHAPKRYVKLVKIPHDESVAITEFSMPVESGVVGDQFTTLLRVYFYHGTVDILDAKEAASKQFINHDISISQKTITKLAGEGSVEVFPLAQPNDANKMCKVSFYLDEVGQLKKLEPNKRASHFAELCGFQNVPLVGDIFVGRVGPNPITAEEAAAMVAAAGGSEADNKVKYDIKGPVNLDFHLSEMSSDAAWLKGVVQHNYELGLRTNRVAMESDLADTDAHEHKELAGAEGVKWVETSDCIEMSVKIPEEIKKFTSKDIAVKIQASSVSVRVRNTSSDPLDRIVASDGYRNVVVAVQPGEFVLLWEGALAGTVSTEDSTWCVSGHHIDLTLEKAGSSQGLWKKLEKVSLK
jgi:hypothetical protein